MAIRKLNLVMSYPVNWSIYTVMNNFVQNFYDAVGHENFMEHFRYKFDGDTITLESDVGFSKEWLYYMGTSSKREDKKKYAGRFGEGFKVASLIAYRDYGLGIQMESRDWRLVVTETDDEIDGVGVKVLAYDIDKKKYENSARLILYNAKEEHFSEIKMQIDHFYYKENARFGEKIAQGKDYAIYEAVKRDIEKRNFGALFINYQLRVTLALPIIVCNHDYTVPGDDRDRTDLDFGEANEAIREVLRQINGQEALRVLEICRPCWKNTYDFRGRNWYRMLDILINKVALDQSAYRDFHNKYGNDFVRKGFNWWTAKHERKMALAWFRQSEYHGKVRIVSDVFAGLDVPSIYKLCYDNNGFDEDAAPDVVQEEYIKILEKVARKWFDKLICYAELPECRILLNKEAPILGKAHCHKEETRIVNCYGQMVKIKISRVYLQEHVLKQDKFSKALVVYLHELLHQFGGDCSVHFKDALEKMNQIILDNLVELKDVEKEWRAIENVAN